MRLSPLLVTGALLPFSLQPLEININQIYRSDEIPQVLLYAAPAGKVHFRLYRIDDPRSFLRGQTDAHTVKEKSERTSSGGAAIWNSFAENFRWSLYSAARSYMRVENREQLRRLLKLKSYAYPFEALFPSENLFKPLKYKLLREWSEDMTRDRSWVKTLPLSKLDPSFYLLEASQGREIAFSPVIVSDLAIIAKEGLNSRLVYAVDLKTGKPADKVKLTAFENPYEQKIEKILFETELNNGVHYDANIGSSQATRTLYLASLGNHYALSDVSFYGRSNQSNLKSAIYSERPVYRQGHEVFFKGIVYRNLGGELTPLKGKANVTVLDPTRKKIFEKSVNLSPLGEFDGRLKLSDQAPLGYYEIIFDQNGAQQSGSFYVEQYKKPSFEVKINPAAQVVIQGTNAVYTLQANYYSGEPVRKATVQYDLKRKKVSYPYWYGFAYWWYYDDGSYYEPWEYYGSGSGVTDENGILTITSATLKDGGSDYVYAISAMVTSSTRETVNGSAEFKAVRGDFSMRITQNRWYYTTGGKADFRVDVKSWAENRPLEGIEIIAELIQRKWDQNAGSYKENSITRQNFRSDKNGIVTGELVLPKESGSYLIRASAKDNSNRVITEEAEFYVWSPWGSEEQTVTLTPDKVSYKITDTARIAVNSSLKAGPMLLVYEADEIYGYQILNISENKENIAEIKLHEKLGPNFTLTAHALTASGKNTSYYGSREIVVPPENKFLKVSVIGDRESYRPGEKASFVIKTTDWQGKPVSTNYSLAVVDEAIFSIRQPNFNDLAQQFYQRRYHNVSYADSFSFRFYGYSSEVPLYARLRQERERYLAEFKAASLQPKVRKDFRDTAFWQASGTTDANGTSLLDITFPDNLTAWRFTVHAVGKDATFGSTQSKFKVSKDFAIRLALPRFVRERDHITLGAVLVNNHNTDLTPQVSVKTEGITVEGKLPDKITLKARSELRIDIPISAPTLPEQGAFNLQVTAIAGKIDSDAIEIKVPVLPWGTPAAVTEQLFFNPEQKSGKLTLSLPKSARREKRLLQLTMTAGVLPSVAETLPYLIQYPYGCVEQTLSTFVPLQQAIQLSNKLNLPLPEKAKEKDKITNAGLEKLYAYQHSDGGWGWWADDETNPYMTAYVLDGLQQAKNAGTKIRDEVIRNGLTRLKQFIREKAGSPEELLYLQTVAAAYEKPSKDTIAAWNAYLKTEKRNPFLVALLAQAALKAGEKNLYQSLLKDLTAQIQKDRAGKYVKPADRDSWRWYNDAAEATAHTLLALTGDKTTMEKEGLSIVAWLLAQKKQNIWRSTRTSALIARALGEYALFTREKLTDSTITVTTNGKKQSVTLYSDRLGPAELSLTTDLEKVEITMERSGSGFFHARADYHYLEGGDILLARSGDFTLERRYYRLEKKNQNNQVFYVPENTPRTSFKTGDLIASVAILKAKDNFEYMLLEDYHPAGFEIADDILSQVRDPAREWQHRPAGRDKFDERTASSRTYFYQNREWRSLNAYRALFPGRFQTMPAIGGMMYYPEFNTNTASDVITITD